jgi:hypothetical protein
MDIVCMFSMQYGMFNVQYCMFNIQYCMFNLQEDFQVINIRYKHCCIEPVWNCRGWSVTLPIYCDPYVDVYIYMCVCVCVCSDMVHPSYSKRMKL